VKIILQMLDTLALLRNPINDIVKAHVEDSVSFFAQTERIARRSPD
jgi:hypothetical protein